MIRTGRHEFETQPSRYWDAEQYRSSWSLKATSKTEEQTRELGFKNVVNLGIVSLFTDISTEMIAGYSPYSSPSTSEPRKPC